MKEKLAALAKEYAKLYKDTGLCGIGINGVHLLREDFEKMFPKYETRYENDDTYQPEEFVVYDGVEFFCLVERKKHEEV